MVTLLTTSPCVDVCKLDGDKVCIGCGRTVQEIERWRSMTDEQRHDINLRLLATQGKQVRRKLLKPIKKKAEAQGPDRS